MPLISKLPFGIRIPPKLQRKRADVDGDLDSCSFSVVVSSDDGDLLSASETLTRLKEIYIDLHHNEDCPAFGWTNLSYEGIERHDCRCNVGQLGLLIAQLENTKAFWNWYYDKLEEQENMS